MATKKIATKSKAASGSKSKTMIGRRVVCRCCSAGVHHGILVSRDGDRVVLRDSERLFYFVVAKMTGMVSSCSEIAAHGINREKSKFGARLEQIEIGGVIEIIPVSPVAEATLQ